MAQRNVNGITAKRGNVLLAFFALFSALLIGVLFWMQIINYDMYQEKVINQITVEDSIPAKRGVIYDRNGGIIATNQTTWRVFISPQDIQSSMYSTAIKNAMIRTRYGETLTASVVGERQDELIAKGLSEILGVEESMILEKAAKINRRDETIKKNVDKETADKVLEFVDKYGLSQQVHIQATNKRYYTYGNMAAQTVGFTGADGGGLYGLEYTYNKELTGVPGKYIIARDARGNEMAYNYESHVEPINGYDMITTLDERIQHELDLQVMATVEDNAPQNRALGIAMNPKTGAIYAISVQPDFNLNEPYVLDTLSQSVLDASGFESGSDEYNELLASLRQVMWSNKATTELYEPGSTFKPITTAMALEEGVVTPTEQFVCSGALNVGGWTIHCHKTSGHGRVTFARGLQQSCNPVLMTIASRVGTEKFCNYFEAFGYLEKSGVDIPGEAQTIFFNRETMGVADLAVASFGQRFKVNPINHLSAICAIANGGYLVTPHILDKFVDEEGGVVYEFDTTPKRQVISTETAKTITEILEAGVSGDGGAKNAYVKGYKIAAKTGTSEKFDDPEAKFRISSTVAYAPADDPQIAVIIVVDEPTGDSVYGSVVAAPYVARFLENVLPYLGVEPQYNSEELSKMQVSVARYIGNSVDVAKGKIKELGLNVEVVGGGDTVTAQIPARGAEISRENGKVILYTNNADPESKTVKVPEVLGLTAAEANKKIINAGLNIAIKGAQNYEKGSGAIVTSQSVSAGSEVPYGTVVSVEVLHMDGTD